MVQVFFKKRDFKFSKAKNSSALKDLKFSSHNSSKKQKVFDALKSVSEGGVKGSELASAAGFLMKKGALSRKDTEQLNAFMRKAGYKGKKYSYKDMGQFETASSSKNAQVQNVPSAESKTFSPRDPRNLEKKVYGQNVSQDSGNKFYGQKPILNSPTPMGRAISSPRLSSLNTGMTRISPSFKK